MNVYLASALTQCVIQTIQMLHSLCLWKCACDGQETKVPKVVAGGPLRKLAGQGAKVPNVVAGGPLRNHVDVLLAHTLDAQYPSLPRQKTQG